jgi:hypothetical protein
MKKIVLVVIDGLAYLSYLADFMVFSFGIYGVLRYFCPDGPVHENLPVMLLVVFYIVGKVLCLRRGYVFFAITRFRMSRRIRQVTAKNGRIPT